MVGEIEQPTTSPDRYDYALHSIQHAILLAPQNPFHALHAAEIAYTVGDIPLAAKLFLGAVDMIEDPELDAAARVEAVPEGIAVRAWFGVKQVSLDINCSWNPLLSANYIAPMVMIDPSLLSVLAA